MYSLASSGFVSLIPSSVMVSYGSGSRWLSGFFFVVPNFCNFVPSFCISFSIVILSWFLLFSSIFPGICCLFVCFLHFCGFLWVLRLSLIFPRCCAFILIANASSFFVLFFSSLVSVVESLSLSFSCVISYCYYAEGFLYAFYPFYCSVW